MSAADLPLIDATTSAAAAVDATAAAGRVGRDAGRVVLRFELPVPRPPDQVRDLLPTVGGASRPGPDEPVFRTWDVDRSPAGARVALTVWLDDADVEAMAAVAAAEHDRFARTVGALDAVAPQGADRRALRDDYGRRIAAALADTD